MAPWRPSDMTKALQQSWWYRSTTSLVYGLCSVNKPPHYDFKFPCVARSSSQKTQPHAIFQDFFFLPPPLWFPPFLLNSGFQKLPDGHSSQKEGRMVEIEGLKGGRESTCVTHFWIDEMCQERKTLNGEEKRKIFCSPGRGCDSGRWACYVMSVSHLLNLPGLHNSRWLRDTCGLNNPILLSHGENIYNHYAALWDPSPYSVVE